MIKDDDVNFRTEGFTVSNSLPGFSDPTGQFPRKDYFFKPSLNSEAIGESREKISLGGGDPTISLEDFEEESISVSEYTKVQVQATASGHKLIFDDTPGSQRVIVKHNSGAGMEFKSDGGINIRSKNNMAISIDANGVIILEGDLRISSKNLTVDVTGDMDMKVDGDYNLTVSGDKKENISGSSRDTIGGNRGEIIKGNSSSTILGASTNTILGTSNNIVKGDYNYSIGGASSFAIGSEYKFTAQGEIVQSAPSISISAADISVVGAAGTIGGQEVTYYGNTFHATRVNATSMHATTFHGDLNGTALRANDTSKQNYGEAATSGAPFSYTSTTGTETETALPTEALMTEVLTNSSRGIKEVSIDEKNYIFNKIDRTEKMGGVANRKLNIQQARTKLKDTTHQNNSKFIQTLVADGVLSHTYLNKVPSGIGRSYSGRGTIAFIPDTASGSTAGSGTGKFIAGSQSSITTYKPNIKYDPNRLEINTVKDINAKTELGLGLPLSTFLAGPGFATNLGHIATIEDRLALARQLLMQADVVQIIRKNNGKFKDFRIVVAEGVYKPLSTETLTAGGILDLAKTGRAITYELYDNNNKIYNEITYEFAEYLAEYLPLYDKIILHYDNIDPNAGNKLHSQVTVIMPEINNEYKIISSVQPKFILETYYNGKIMSNTDLVEIDPFAIPDQFAIAVSSIPGVVEYKLGKIRDKPVKPALERILAQAAAKAGVDKVIITSGTQPGTSGKRIGSTRHDTGMAADLYLQIGGEDVTLDTYKGRKTIEKFVRAAVSLGIRAGGMSAGYMGNKVMHLDTLGASLGSGKYSSDTPVAWKSDNWFASAIIST